ncbi:MAG: DNA repair protein RadA [Proteobacteria bacterium]|nr:DNA repair protein RadA [Pseudomonadota bacterium]
MAAAAHRYACQSCGATAPKWSGRCEACGEWNTIVEEVPREAAPKGLGRGAGRKIELVAIQQAGPEPARIVTRIGELDRVFGGGLVEGSTILVAGDPGIGKSTLLLQAAAALARDGRTCVYVSGEESAEQVRLRARRLGLGDAPVLFAAATSVRDVLATLDSSDRPDAVVVDSIQTMYVDSLDSAPGSVAQVRASAHELIRFAKRRGAVLLLVGHVTKDGQIAGPRVLEHMVDTVLYFEGERSHQFRILRAVKNRFGATDEIGVFEMTDSGLNEVPNPSALFLGERDRDASGAAVFAGVEGSRPVLVEIQALVAPSSLATPRRAVVGSDSARLAMVMAVLDARCGLALGGNDVYLNVAGGLRISEPAADLAVAAALVSSLTGTPVPANTVVFGEVGLSGEVRQVGQADMRLKEAAKLGFAKALIPRRKSSGKSAGATPLEVAEVDRLSDLVDRLGGDRGRGA